ncbi:IRK-interacting protein [Cinnamomum micranthum f. kanehirae]|uniref:IRK-interacting protein n=1 Tax=Cinnamomum micranthum f. kanehirae TaxID=337451 RepID=A0A443P9V2_9MAGN|nr:IRK-interacting protein [Cinnamomum micranthum f. kanehirae]
MLRKSRLCQSQERNAQQRPRAHVVEKLFIGEDNPTVVIRRLNTNEKEEEEWRHAKKSHTQTQSYTLLTTVAMPPTGLKEAQIRENSNQKVHPQPMEETMNQSQEAFEALVAKIFTNVSSLKAAYIQLQAAHTPYDPDKIQAADKLVIEELKNLSELKHSYRDSNPKPISASPQDSKLVTEIQEQQNLLKTYEVMVKKFQSQLQTKDSEILQLQRQIQESNQRKVKLEKKLKQRGLQAKESENLEENSFFSMELTPSLFSSAVEAAYKAIHDFSKPLINLMKAAGWDLDAAANAIQPAVVYAKKSHQKYAFESHICQRMFAAFDEESFSVKHDDLSISKEGFFHQFLALRVMDPLDVLSQNADSIFGRFCRSKYLSVIHPKMEASFFGSLDQRNYVAGGGHPRTPFYQAFLKTRQVDLAAAPAGIFF